MNLNNLISHFAHRSFLSFVLFSCLSFFVFQSIISDSEIRSEKNVRINSFAQLPLKFEKNMGQLNSDADFLFQSQALTLSLKPNKSIISLRQAKKSGSDNHETKPHTVTMSLNNANPNAVGEGLDKIITKTNYFLGNDSTNWRKNIPNYSKVQFREIYPGIDLVYYGKDGKLEYDFTVSPGKNPNVIALQFEKENDAKLNEKGDLVLQAGNVSVVMQSPIAYQELNNSKKYVEASYAYCSETSFGFEVGDYDKSLPLVIDPVLVFSSYLSEECEDITTDSEGNIYIVGGSWRVFVTKLAPDGSAEIFTTYLNGDLDDFGKAIAVDNEGYIYVTGETQSNNFPIKNALQEDFGGLLWVDGDAFVTKLNPDGSTIVYSTYLGGYSGDIGRDITVDLEGNAYVTGSTWGGGFPVYNALQPNHIEVEDVFVSKIAPDGSSFIFSTFLGGSNSYGLGRDEGYGIAIDKENNIYITGSTWSDNFPTTVNAFQSKYVRYSTFVSKMNSLGTELIYSTYLSAPYNGNIGGGEVGKSIAVDNAGHAYVTGFTNSPEFPTTNAIQPSFGGGFNDCFLTKFTLDGSDLIFSTYLGGSGNEDERIDIKVDTDGNAIITGATSSTNFPTEQPIQSFLKGNSDAFITTISSDGLNLLFSSYLGGTGYDRGKGISIKQNGNILVAGYAGSQDFPTLSPLKNSGGGFVAEIDLGQSEEMLFVKVMQDSLGRTPLPVPNTEFGIYKIDLSKPDDPLTFVNFKTTDNKGLLGLPLDYFSPGDPFFLRAIPHSVKAKKANHEELDDWMYRIYIDNLHIDREGEIQAAKLESNKLDTTKTYMEHTSLGYNLLVSIEWPASDEYIAGLTVAFMSASNLLYDITNGQAFFNSVVIYDNKRNWKDADILIYSSNTQWPRAAYLGMQNPNTELKIHLPPVHYGDKDQNINEIFNNEPLTPFNLNVVHLIPHEFGHYGFGFYDEYQDPSGTSIEIFTNYGFMDQSPPLEPWLSEMSGYYRLGYTATEQYTRKNKTCWEYWKAEFEKIPKYNFGALYATIKTPEDMSSGWDLNEYVEGPNANLNTPNFDVGSMMKFIYHISHFNDLRRVFLMVNKETNQPVGDTEVYLKKPSETKEFIPQGKTVKWGDNVGKIRPLGMQIGDELRSISGGIDIRNRYLFSEIEVTSSLLSKTSSEQNEIVVELQQLKGNYSLLPEVLFNDNGSLMFSASANKSFSSFAQLELIKDDGTVDLIDLTESMEIISGGSNEVGTTYEGELPEENYSNATMFFKTADSTNNPFFLPIKLSLYENSGSEIILSQDNIYLNSEETSTATHYVVTTTSSFPIPSNGLPNVLRRASSLISLQAFPASASMNVNFQVIIEADSFKAAESSAIIIYQYKDQWQPLPTNVDLEYGVASTLVSEPGYYMVFLDETKSIVGVKEYDAQAKLPNSFGLHQNYPNPFNPSTIIKYSIPNQSKVTLKVFDVLGREVSALINKQQSQGNYEIEFDGTELTSGIYFYRLQAGDYAETKKMLLIK